MMCSFCGDDVEEGTEKIFVTLKGKAHYFCSSKCEKNMLKLGRKARKVKWTKEYRSEKDIRLKALAKAKPKKKREKPAKKTKDNPKKEKEKKKEKTKKKKPSEAKKTKK